MNPRAVQPAVDGNRTIFSKRHRMDDYVRECPDSKRNLSGRKRMGRTSEPALNCHEKRFQGPGDLGTVRPGGKQGRAGTWPGREAAILEYSIFCAEWKGACAASQAWGKDRRKLQQGARRREGIEKGARSIF